MVSDNFDIQKFHDALKNFTAHGRLEHHDDEDGHSHYKKVIKYQYYGRHLPYEFVQGYIESIVIPWLKSNQGSVQDFKVSKQEINRYLCYKGFTTTKDYKKACITFGIWLTAAVILTFFLISLLSPFRIGLLVVLWIGTIISYRKMCRVAPNTADIGKMSLTAKYDSDSRENSLMVGNFNALVEFMNAYYTGEYNEWLWKYKKYNGGF
jgi:hypothetical protein